MSLYPHFCAVSFFHYFQLRFWSRGINSFIKIFIVAVFFFFFQISLLRQWNRRRGFSPPSLSLSSEPRHSAAFCSSFHWRGIHSWENHMLMKTVYFCLIQMASLHYVHKALKTVIRQPSAAATTAIDSLTSRSDAEHCRFILMNLSVWISDWNSPLWI